MSPKRRQYSAEYKFKVALEAAKGSKTLAELSSATGVHANQISQWKAKLLDGGASLFQKAKPFFVGIIFGEGIAAGIWLIVNAIVVLNGGMGQGVKFLL